MNARWRKQRYDRLMNGLKKGGVTVGGLLLLGAGVHQFGGPVKEFVGNFMQTVHAQKMIEQDDMAKDVAPGETAIIIPKGASIPATLYQRSEALADQYDNDQNFSHHEHSKHVDEDAQSVMDEIYGVNDQLYENPRDTQHSKVVQRADRDMTVTLPWKYDKYNQPQQ